MKSIFYTVLVFCFVFLTSFTPNNDDFQGQAFYYSKSKMELGNWGARMSEAQKKQVYQRLKNRLEKTYILTFNKEESIFDEADKLDAISGATDSWGNNFSRGKQYKNVKEDLLVQSQEFYGKKFLVKDKLQAIEWKMGSESKQVGQYTCFKATASIPTDELTWYDFSWGDLRRDSANDTADATTGEDVEPEIDMTEVEAWYTMQIPVRHGPGEYWGLPGLILEVSAGNTVMLCSKVVMNPKETIKIEAPDKGKETTKKEYQTTVRFKMQEMRDNRGRRRN
ncbi:MAG: GLPGLI family protein [Bacteroidia bacterium]|nr:GLPGLI family protein [Bacteroidia bacterium]NNF31089.1 GLPGLI family protein [Flavobacteriaceae bacterium]MBT8276947.1 GLPGLI family protein [Bacteroidia bacterium]NNJ82457.1 GLPGLI family protein [Flavobacteriaceae bacterium]NNK55322.1 GLPGLI family protein [Flavobacteriaceae bacterium]